MQGLSVSLKKDCSCKVAQSFLKIKYLGNNFFQLPVPHLREVLSADGTYWRHQVLRAGVAQAVPWLALEYRCAHSLHTDWTFWQVNRHCSGPVIKHFLLEKLKPIKTWNCKCDMLDAPTQMLKIYVNSNTVFTTYRFVYLHTYTKSNKIFKLRIVWIGTHFLFAFAIFGYGYIPVNKIK